MRADSPIVLIHWQPEELETMAAELRAAGCSVRGVSDVNALDMAGLRAAPPAAVVISLRRLPSHGREVADALCSTQWGRAIPIVFADGAPDKVEALRARFAAASFLRWTEIVAGCSAGKP